MRFKALRPSSPCGRPRCRNKLRKSAAPAYASPKRSLHDRELVTHAALGTRMALAVGCPRAAVCLSDRSGGRSNVLRRRRDAHFLRVRSRERVGRESGHERTGSSAALLLRGSCARARSRQRADPRRSRSAERRDPGADRSLRTLRVHGEQRARRQTSGARSESRRFDPASVAFVVPRRASHRAHSTTS